jgi:hypothetical protein
LQQQFPAASKILETGYYDPHPMMASVLQQMYSRGELSWHDKGDGTGYLARNEGSCRFCVNRHWQFPNECRYGKTVEAQPPVGYLEKVAAQIVATGKTQEAAKTVAQSVGAAQQQAPTHPAAPEKEASQIATTGEPPAKPPDPAQ